MKHTMGLSMVIITMMLLSACNSTDPELQKKYDAISKDMVEQYEVAKREGDKALICRHAGMVSAAYLQAKDEATFAKWKAIEKRDCKDAGVYAQ